MTTHDAQKSIAEVRRVLRSGGMFYADMIAISKLRLGRVDDNLDQLIDEKHELGTIQSYYDEAKIARVFDGLEIVKLEKISRITDKDDLLEMRWHGVFRCK